MKNIINKKAKYNYFLIEKFNAGMVLLGKEIKFIRHNKFNINKSYCKINKLDVILLNFKIYNLKTRNIKLLLSKKELNKIKNKILIHNYAIIPYKVFFSNSGFAKIIIYLSKIKKKYDKTKLSKKKEKEIYKKEFKKYYFY